MNVAIGDQLSASELNAAIDDTNFPRHGNVENGNVENGKKLENGDGNFRRGSFKRDVTLDTPRSPRTTTTPGKLSISNQPNFYI